MIFLPTRGRPDSIKRFAAHYDLTKATVPVVVIIDADNQDAYANVVLPPNWKVFINPKCRDLVGAFNAAFEAYPDEAFYGLMADDLVPETPGWDTALAEAATPHYIAWGNDTIWTDGSLPTHPFIGGDLARACGWLVSPYTNRHCQDFIWKDFADTLKIGKFLPDVVYRHLHWQCGTAPYDTTYAIQPSAAEGHKQYHFGYKQSDQFRADVERVRKSLNL